MAANLRKYKFTKRPERSPTQGTPANRNGALPVRTKATGMTAEKIKADVLSSLRGDLANMLREEVKNALAKEFGLLKSELQAVRSEITTNTIAIWAEMDQMKGDIKDVGEGLSTWSDEVNLLQTVVTTLKSQVKELQVKSEDMEGRMRRGNIRIVGVDEQPDSSSPEAISKLLKEALHLDRDIKIDRSHRSLMKWKPGDRPRVIIAKLHNDGDAAEVLRRARDRAPLNYNGKRIAIVPDYTNNIAKARAAFTDVRKMLRGRQGVRYGPLFRDIWTLQRLWNTC
ncbi:LINE-1 retrotransposable element ORF1 protein [Dissostichus eleginoides]|uniref:LINE-1 retrotransposable element ORF1 protein n=1 Tax=Dissostichus eleginoides TaxID=100907 RepID=A0AAD9F9K3_DISEL|nr:LINE-1 retrotransposable element ORF1 protein [Dissostichus eleginoides]